MSSSWSERHEQVIEQCLASEEAFRAYVTSSEHPSNVRRAYLAFRGLVRLFSESVDDREELEKKVNELEHAKSRIEGALTYVEEQLNTLRAAPPAAPPASMPSPPTPVAPMATHPIHYPTLPIQSPTAPFPATAPASVAPDFAHVATSDPTPALVTTPSETHETPSEPSGRPHRVIKIPDPPIFHGKPGMDEISYKDWLLKMKTKLRVNDVLMPTEFYKTSYIESRLADNALAQVSPRLDDESKRPFTTAKERNTGTRLNGEKVVALSRLLC